MTYKEFAPDYDRDDNGIILFPDDGKQAGNISAQSRASCRIISIC